MEDADYGHLVAGKHYVHLLADLHQHLAPERYLEIGVFAGATLQLAQCASIGVDPEFVIESDIMGAKPECHLFQQTSDDFFAATDPTQILGGPIDLAFLDGLHWFEFLLRDFINTEQHCSPESVIVLHDCLPPGFYMTSRDIADASHPLSKFQGWWAGDVWKMVPTLRKYRPDLRLTVTDCVPTGLVIVTGLDPSNQALRSGYDAAVEDFAIMDRAEFDAYWSEVEVTPADQVDLNAATCTS